MRTKIAVAVAMFSLIAGLANGSQALAAPPQHSAHVLAARLPCSAPPPFGTGTCPGVRPGAIVYTGNSACTMNFLFKGSDGRRYIGTAGHCALEMQGEHVWPIGRGPSASDRDRNRFGSLAYAILKGPKDFALIRIDRGVKAEPGMCYFGGPNGTNNDRSEEQVVLHFFGNGDAIGNVPVANQPVLPARTVVAYDTTDPDQVIAAGAAIFGDSGSGVISEDGRAMGVLVAISPLEAGNVITRLTPQLERAEHKLGIRLRLLQADLES